MTTLNKLKELEDKKHTKTQNTRITVGLTSYTPSLNDILNSKNLLKKTNTILLEQDNTINADCVV